jgi:hypothetical protein
MDHRKRLDMTASLRVIAPCPFPLAQFDPEGKPELGKKVPQQKNPP